MTDTMSPTAAPTTADGLTESEAAEFRQKCVDFMEAHAKRNGVPTIEEQKAYLAAAAEAGLAGVPFPAEYGGGGLTLAHEKIWREVKSNYTMMDGEFIISHGMCLPMLNEWGTPEQKERFLADNISGRTMWCQMFSEPGAGSDVASLQSKAELDGDEWVLNGQKVWTTLAHKSDYGIVVVRTDPDQVKHAGLSMFIMDMKAPGVEIRPIHQIDGGSHFNEVFFTDVRIPKDWQIGELNAGWRLATSMLMYERVAIGGAGAGKISQPNFKHAGEGGHRDRSDRQPGRARSADEDLVDGDHQVARGDEEPRRAEGRQDARARRFARQAVRIGDRVARARDVARVRRSRLGGMGSVGRIRRRPHEGGAQLVPIGHRRRYRRDPAQHHR